MNLDCPKVERERERDRVRTAEVERDRDSETKWWELEVVVFGCAQNLVVLDKPCLLGVFEI